MCDLAASNSETQLDCNKPFRWNSRYMGEWIAPPERTEVLFAHSETICSILCLKNSCISMQLLGGKWVVFKVDLYGCYITKFLSQCADIC